MARICGLDTKRLQASLVPTGAAALLLLLIACNRSEPVTNTSTGPAEILFGTRITFGKGGNSEPYKAGGWGQTEEKFTWTEGTSALLRVPVAATNDPITFKIRMAALIKPPELPLQPVQVYINDQKIAEWQVGDTAEFATPIPPGITKLGGVLTINFKTPKATSPKALGISVDPRVLGICVLDFELSKA